MDETHIGYFYEIMDLIYRFNRKYPEIRFGQLIHNLATKEESLFYLSDELLFERLIDLLELEKE